ncbi:unnamed protein product [Caenorhabditis bovis]|uniref:UBC core domain-containing protein n=1 Tax=Caenorhabditis bovis TaxID=2654633 RepID=A0A8S1EHB5_9PELO|nr:unnamed protein product [Caenorhabditis bovis]
MTHPGTTEQAEGCHVVDDSRCLEKLEIPKDTLIRHALASEFSNVCRNPVDGIFVSPSALNPFQWFGVVFIRKGIFGGGIFRFTFDIPSDFPETSELPTVTFDNALFHPLIDLKTRQLDLSRSFPDGWKREKHNLLRVLIVVQRIFFSYEFDCDKCINPEAAILYKEHKEKFKEMAKDVVETSRAQVYDDPKNNDDPNSIRFTPWDASVHEALREQIMLLGSGQRPTSITNSEASPKTRIPNLTGSEYRRERDLRERGIAASELVGKHFPRTYSWFDPDAMTVLTRPVENDEIGGSDVNSARLDREKHGIEPLDLSAISVNNSADNSPRDEQKVGETAGENEPTENAESVI